MKNLPVDKNNRWRMRLIMSSSSIALEQNRLTPVDLLENGFVVIFLCFSLLTTYLRLDKALIRVIVRLGLT